MSQRIHNYLKMMQESLAMDIVGKNIIYLDTKYWIILRDQFLDINSKKEILNVVLNLVESGKCIFPISEVTYMEILKQSDINNLKVNIELIDKISKGISFITSKEMRRLEFEIFMKSLVGKETVNLENQIWTKLPFILFPAIESNINLGNEAATAVEKLLIDKLWNYSFGEIFERLASQTNYKPFSFSDNVEYFNEQKVIHENENNTFEQMFLSELGGTLDLYDAMYSQVMGDMFFEESGRSPTKEELDDSEFPKYKNIIYNLFKLKKIDKQLPSFRIFSGLFAANRWNKSQKHHKNDTPDVIHATFALPYCDYFFTEKSLANLITQNHTGYDNLYSCHVLHRENDIVNELNKIYGN